MEDALSASVEGLALIDQARKRKGWNRQSAAWAEVALTSVGTLKQFWRGERIGRDTFIRLCHGVGVLDWQAIATTTTSQSTTTTIDWGEAPEPAFFCGREAELATLTQWIVTDHGKLISLLGMGGMGKTTLAVQLVQQFATNGNAHSFDVIVWRSLRNAPPLEALLADLLQVVSDAPVGKLPQTLSSDWLAHLAELMRHLRSRPCLIVLDNAESILTEASSTGTGAYYAGYENYGELLRRLGEERHQSCLVLTSREQPKEVAWLAGEKVRSLRLSGLESGAGQQILERVGAFTASTSQSEAIVGHYAGNPLALKIAAAGIRDLLQGNVGEFLTLLQQGQFVFGDIRDLLERHFTRLSDLEAEVMYWLAIAREPVSLDELNGDLLTPTSRVRLAETLDSLQRRSLLDVTPAGFTLQPAVMEYVTHRLIEQVCRELATVKAQGAANDPIHYLRRYALIKATAKDYIREVQTRLILEPLIEQLRAVYESLSEVKEAIAQLLPYIQGKPASKTGYVAGNVLNLLCHLQVDLQGYDFSHLTIWQADLRRAILHQVNFAESDLARSAFTETFSNVLSVAFSPDGQTIAKSDEQGWVTIWQVGTVQQLRSFQAHSNWVFTVAFSPDGRTLATGGLDRTVKLWDLATGSCRQTIQLHSGGVSAIAFGDVLASSSADQTIRLIAPQTGDCLNTLVGHQGIVRAIAFSPDRQILASGSLDHTIKLWHTVTGECLQTLTDSEAVYAVAFVQCSPGSFDQNQIGQDATPANPPCYLASAGDDRTIKIWDLASGQCIRQLEGHRDRIWSLATNSNGTILISGGDDRTIKIWDTTTGECLKTLPGHQNRIWSIALSPNGQTIVSGSNDRSVRLWNVHDGQCLRVLQGYDNGTSPIAFVNHPPTQTTPSLLTFSVDQTVRLWDWQRQECLQTISLPTKAAMQAAVSPNGQLLASGSLDHTIRLYQLAGACPRTLRGHTAWVRMVTFSPDGLLLASASGDQTVRLWQVATGECLKTLTGHTNPVQSIVFNASGTLLASGSWDWTVKLWDVSTGECLQTLRGHSDQIREISFNPSGQILITSSLDRSLRLWDVATGNCLWVLDQHQAEVVAIACSPDGRLLASGSLDGTIRLWSLPDGDCLTVLTLKTGYCGALLFSPDSRILANGGEDGTCILWDVQQVDQPKLLTTLQVPRPYEGMNITGVKGLTEAQIANLQALGAISAEA